ncbi:response regulator [Methylobacterium sp. A54F]
MPKPGNRAIVLVADDEPVTRQAAAELAMEAGCNVLEARNGSEAIMLLESVPEIRAVITDIEMPGGLDGIHLLACIHVRWPTLGVIMISGKVRPDLGDLPEGGRYYFFAKPYAEERVRAALDDLLRAGTAEDGADAFERAPCERPSRWASTLLSRS